MRAAQLLERGVAGVERAATLGEQRRRPSSRASSPSSTTVLSFGERRRADDVAALPVKDANGVTAGRAGLIRGGAGPEPVLVLVSSSAGDTWSRSR